MKYLLVRIFFLPLQGVYNLQRISDLVMHTDFQDYSLFIKFIENITPLSFKGTDPANPLMFEVEQMMDKYDEFFYLADIILMKVLYTSNCYKVLVGCCGTIA